MFIMSISPNAKDISDGIIDSIWRIIKYIFLIYLIIIGIFILIGSIGWFVETPDLFFTIIAVGIFMYVVFFVIPFIFKKMGYKQNKKKKK